MNLLQEKLTKLNELLLNMGSAAIAFSGGVDSSFLAAAASRVLGDKAIAVTAYSATLAEREKKEAVAIAAKIGIKHVLLPISELDSADFIANTAKRCYYCKKERFSVLSQWAQEQGIAWVLEGSNADDVSDYRPGMQAINELEKVKSPLLEVGITKEEIRALSKQWQLPTWNKLSAACLSSRVQYGMKITAEKLHQVEQAEEFVRGFCSGQVRVRHHGNLARIEVSAQDIAGIAREDNAAKITGFIKQLGFTYVTLDLAGYRTGSMNEVLAK
ncbi:MAG: ATP-dependent sacrificial sulfur transferase LarE [Veillonellales bacterium]